ncbi:hypothetical protein M427DRAFT_65660 [Gonapodya prolifera JEL478]|uniref:Nucleoside phosphatase GDA1/CD39 n=1 Tax=Gonapodya prolifera (strain JEL478) TaxID=1344416 RepID=A0A139AYY5_GONPJ|nr:hypothetical protein M427DRAFT_65660 [Gonapodya prolifera JEL478]|eukprot:KXS21685.1 hypothetical protein M427DRAFT_65660 [Gonapodya prolifera JEL478]
MERRDNLSERGGNENGVHTSTSRSLPFSRSIFSSPAIVYPVIALSALILFYLYSIPDDSAIDPLPTEPLSSPTSLSNPSQNLPAFSSHLSLIPDYSISELERELSPDPYPSLEAVPHHWYLNRKYIAVVDAGSSGSRIHIYSWKDPAWVRRQIALMLRQIDVLEARRSLDKRKDSVESEPHLHPRAPSPPSPSPSPSPSRYAPSPPSSTPRAPSNSTSHQSPRYRLLSLLHRLPLVRPADPTAPSSDSSSWVLAIRPSLSSLAEVANDKAKVSAYLAPLLDFAQKRVGELMKRGAQAPLKSSREAQGGEDGKSGHGKRGKDDFPELDRRLQQDSPSGFTETDAHLSQHHEPQLSPRAPIPHTPSSTHPPIPILILATAGLRLLPPATQKLLLDTTCSVLSLRPQFTPAGSSCLSSVRVIDGKWEGAFGWVAVNALAGTLDEAVRGTLGEGAYTARDGGTFGFLDMGGASAQIAFMPPREVAEAHADDLTRVPLRAAGGWDVEVGVYVRTFLGFGVREARRRYEEMVAAAAAAAAATPAGGDGDVGGQAGATVDLGSLTQTGTTRTSRTTSAGATSSLPSGTSTTGSNLASTTILSTRFLTSQTVSRSTTKLTNRGTSTRPTAASSPASARSGAADESVPPPAPPPLPFPPDEWGGDEEGWRVDLDNDNDGVGGEDDVWRKRAEGTPTSAKKTTSANTKSKSIQAAVIATTSASLPASRVATQAPLPTSTLIPDPCLPQGLVYDSDPASLPPPFLGTGNFSRCLETLLPLLNKTAPCPDPPCLFAGTHVPAHSTAPGYSPFSTAAFLGVSEYFYTAASPWNLHGAYRPGAFVAEAKKFCDGLTWKDVVRAWDGGEFPGVDKVGELETQCWRAAWVVSVLHEGLGLPMGEEDGLEPGPGQTVSPPSNGTGLVPHVPFQTVDEIARTRISWTLGAAIIYVSESVPPSGAVEDRVVDEAKALEEATPESLAAASGMRGGTVWGQDGKGTPTRTANAALSGNAIGAAAVVVVVVVALVVWSRRRVPGAVNGRSARYVGVPLDMLPLGSETDTELGVQPSVLSLGGNGAEGNLRDPYWTLGGSTGESHHFPERAPSPKFRGGGGGVGVGGRFGWGANGSSARAPSPGVRRVASGVGTWEKLK